MSCFAHCNSSQLGSTSTVFRCDNDDWCCSDGRNTTSYCNDPQVKLFKIVRNAYVQNRTAFIQGYNIALDEDITGTATPSAPSSTSKCTTTATGQSFDGATAVWLGVGLGVGIPLLAATGVLSLLLREKKRSQRISTHGGFANSMDQIARSSVQAELVGRARPSTHVESPRAGLTKLPNTQLAEAGPGQRRSVHEIYGKEHPQAAELSDHKA